MTRAKSAARARKTLAYYRSHPVAWCKAKGHDTIILPGTGRSIRVRCERCGRRVWLHPLGVVVRRTFDAGYFARFQNEASPFLDGLK